MKKLTLAAGALALTFITPAFANDDMDHKAMGEAMFKKMDTNGDGYISKEEHAAATQKMFMDADTNGDGKLSKDEMMAHKMKEKEAMKTSDQKVKTSDDAKSTTNSSATMEK